jgi:deazaflavin-dependent oxidoreductase (nitroreductase family)
VLTTRGRRSGEPRHTVLEHTWLDGRIYIAPGWGGRTQWYRNLLVEPRVTVQRHGETFAAVASPVTGDAELARVYPLVSGSSPVWKQFLASWGIEDSLEDFLAKKDRIPTVRLDRVPGALELPAVGRNLIWVWLVPAAVIAALVVALT